MALPEDKIWDLIVIGGGVNGCGVARDAAGRGLSVLLVEKNDLGWATSSASTKLFHGGLRYLEYFEFRLVREALIERETLLRAMPHIAWPMRFVLPINPDLRYETDTSSLGKMLSRFAPFLKGRRPAWLTRMGLFVYDHLGGRKILPGTSSIDLSSDPVGAPLQSKYRKAFEYSDCWVEDSRLVVLNARDAEARGATVLTRTECEGADREDGLWTVRLSADGAATTARARGLVNAGGPWVGEVLNQRLRQNSDEGVRLVRGSHIVTRKLYDHAKPYFLQQQDGRIIFAIPYETDFTLIGTTDKDHDADAGEVVCTDEERDYLLRAASEYFEMPVTVDDVVWKYAGVRPLYDDNATSATAATRDYVLSLGDAGGAAPLLNIFGGKITTYRRLAEEAVAKLDRYFPDAGEAWTAGAPLPGGDFPVGGAAELCARLIAKYDFLDERWALRLTRAYGLDAFKMLGDAKVVDDLGQRFGWNLTALEVDWLVTREWARTAEDILWRRSKIGLRVTPDEIEALRAYLAKTTAAAAA
ncbi:MAG: glycerol-3-phosphate dehydrogenase [Pseudomonadota bacterium]